MWRNWGSPVNCNSRIALDNGHGQAETYCILPIKHEGKCVPDAGIAARYAKRTEKETNTNGISTDILPTQK